MGDLSPHLNFREFVFWTSVWGVLWTVFQFVLWTNFFLSPRKVDVKSLTNRTGSRVKFSYDLIKFSPAF